MTDSLDTQKTYWEDVASSTWGMYISSIQKRAILKAHTMANMPTTALEIGCDGGRWSELLSGLGWDMICTDVNPTTLSMCEQRIPTAECILVNETDSDIPTTNESIDLLLCIEVDPVIESDWFIPESLRVLRKNGLMVGVFWNRVSFRGFYYRMTASYQKKLDFYKLNYSTWRKKLCRSGFHMQHEEGLCWFPFKRGSNSPYVNFFTKTERVLCLHKCVIFSPWIVFIAQKI